MLKTDSAATQLVAPSETDQVQLFMLFTLFGGDAARAALAGRTEPEIVERLAHDFNWRSKTGGRGAIDTDAGITAERTVNRVSNYVTSQRLGNVFTSLIKSLDADPEFARAFCTSVDSETGEKKFSTKNLTDLAKGLEIANNIGYRALGDKEARAADVSGEPSAGDLARDVYKKLAGAFDANLVVDTVAQLRAATTDATPAPAA